MEWFEFKEKLEDFGLEFFNRYYGLYKGFVANREDPDGIGRLQLFVPAIYGDKKVFKYWAFPRGMAAGKDIGMFFIPEQGDKVWVSFENGDPRYPVWEFGWWAKGEQPKDATPKVKVIMTKSGHRLMFDDEKEIITLTTKDDLHLKIDKNKISVDAQDKDIYLYAGENKLEMTQAGINVDSPLPVTICGQFEALYNKVPGMPILDVSQIGVATKVKIG